MRVLFFATCLLFAYGIIQAQDEAVIIDSLEVALAEEEMMFKEDSASYLYNFFTSDIEFIPGEDSPALIEARLRLVEKTIPLHYNDRIHSFINYFTVRDREYTRMIIRRKNVYFPLFEKYLAQYGLPDELKYLSIIESGLNPKAVSRARAVGLWQFMAPTGRIYGLHADWYTDDRMDPDKSTEAACRYLRDLYNMFHDWELALASYNAGPGNVKKAIRRSGYKKTFWEVFPYLPRETRSYVPQFVAMIYTMNYLEDHNFMDGEHEAVMPYDTLQVKSFVHLETLAQLTGSCLEDIQRLNPAVLRNAIPDNAKQYTLRIPQFAKAALDTNRLAILDSASRIGRKEMEILARNTDASTYGRDRIVYRVKSGDNLGSIALRHHVTVASLKEWNKISGTTIYPGQQLTIWTKPPASSSVIGSNATVSAKATPIPTDVPAPLTNAKTYIVQPGDTLWSISRKYEGLTIEKIKQLNNLSSTNIKPGQQLILSL